MRLKPILIGLILICFFALPVLADGTGEENLRVLDKDGNVIKDYRNSEGSAKVSDDDDNEEKNNDGNNENLNTTDTSGMQTLLKAPITGLNYLMNIPPAEKAILLIVGCAIGISIVLTILSFAANNGRMGWGGIVGNLTTIKLGRNAMIVVFFGFMGFLFALAILNYTSTSSMF